MIAKIFFYENDHHRINSGDEEYYRKVLKVQHPLSHEKHEEGITRETIGEYRFIGEIDTESVDDAYARLQNAFESHELHNRSMSIGDVIVINGRVILCSDWNRTVAGWIELFGWRKDFFLNY